MKRLALLLCSSMIFTGSCALAEPDYVLPSTETTPNKLLITTTTVDARSSLVKLIDDICISCIGSVFEKTKSSLN